jgi:predicted nuclease of predicted toxin-antitoxin system
VKLLFDENISFRIVRGVLPHFPDSQHTKDIVPALTGDHSIFKFAKENDFTIVTFDVDFQHIQMMNGFPPKIIWLRLGNTSTLDVLNRLLEKSKIIIQFINNEDSGTLEIY